MRVREECLEPPFAIVTSTPICNLAELSSLKLYHALIPMHSHECTYFCKPLFCTKCVAASLNLLLCSCISMKFSVIKVFATCSSV